jgi:hypothetical protein
LTSGAARGLPDFVHRRHVLDYAAHEVLLNPQRLSAHREQALHAQLLLVLSFLFLLSEQETFYDYRAL